MISPSDPPDVTVTIVGSSNYGVRSFNLDLEVDVLIVTKDPDLRSRIHSEESRLLAHGTPLKKQHLWRTGGVDSILAAVLMWIICIAGLSI